MRAATNTREHGVVIRLQWMSEHFEVPGNEAADRLAREAATLAKLIHSPLCCRGRKLSSGTRSAPGGKEIRKSPERAATAGLGEALIHFRKWYTLPVRTRIYIVVVACISLRREVRVNNNYLPTYLMYGNIFYSEELGVYIAGDQQAQDTTPVQSASSASQPRVRAPPGCSDCNTLSTKDPSS